MNKSKLPCWLSYTALTLAFIGVCIFCFVCAVQNCVFPGLSMAETQAVGAWSRLAVVNFVGAATSFAAWISLCMPWENRKSETA